ncbi:CidA/LrgA family protein [Dysgonomonas sp. 511]|uniref:CidA/LrgA family protein n=1 Tax=Dysgonomonas sp. 511 TaxID=2302930 RepID=UPI0013D645DC|nr:CidA/LrgA family protein [Dysgonomonas sp. 511]NDV78978.1 CidA/LrgA family protein [Dysgonomonas sp. 511]
MKMVKGIFIILLFYFLGEGISYLINGFIPGNIIGMILLFLSLCLKAFDPDNVKDVANAFTRNMAIFFIPAGAGLLGSYGLISKFWMSILIVCSVSTMLVIAVVGVIQQRMEKKKDEGAV